MSDDDITSNYHGGNQFSHAANKRTNKERDRNKMYAYVFSCGFLGSTSDQAQDACDLPHQTGSARFCELKKDGQIVPNGDVRKTRKNCNAEVCIAKPFWEELMRRQQQQQQPPLPAQPDLFS